MNRLEHLLEYVDSYVKQYESLKYAVIHENNIDEKYFETVVNFGENPKNTIELLKHISEKEREEHMCLWEMVKDVYKVREEICILKLDVPTNAQYIYFLEKYQWDKGKTSFLLTIDLNSISGDMFDLVQIKRGEYCMKEYPLATERKFI